MMKRTIHLVASILATVCIATFLLSTVLVEILGSPDSIAMVKSLIVSPGLFILIPTMAVIGGSGFVLSKGRRGRLIDNKKKRMPFIGMNGLLVLVPCALFLDHWAAAGSLDAKFYAVQGLELLAGAGNLTLMGMNMRDGLKMTGKLRSKKVKSQ